MKKFLIISIVINVLLIIGIVAILNTDYEIMINGQGGNQIIIRQKIFDYLRGAE